MEAISCILDFQGTGRYLCIGPVMPSYVLNRAPLPGLMVTGSERRFGRSDFDPKVYIDVIGFHRGVLNEYEAKN